MLGRYNRNPRDIENEMYDDMIEMEKIVKRSAMNITNRFKAKYGDKRVDELTDDEILSVLMEVLPGQVFR